MPGRLGPRFAIEALFLIALAVGAAYADLANKWIVLVMAGGWLVVALLELAADRIWAAAPPWGRFGPVPKRRWFRRRQREDTLELIPEPELPKHVRLLPPSEHKEPASDEVSELFETSEPEEEQSRG